jgi:hypothetical protein
MTPTVMQIKQAVLEKERCSIACDILSKISLLDNEDSIKLRSILKDLSLLQRSYGRKISLFLAENT